MLTLLALLLTAPPICTTVKQPCRACTEVRGKRVCSTLGIACQPKVRVCKPAAGKAPATDPAKVTTRDR
ncbi:hypothetical protein Q5H91_08720 [Sphingomonas sp. KR1UV-12]|uniref:Uncharacterized protein n=1 Tax=Sphingomonas aurea TaxID=3063994 RepID=A0ABT9EKZ6_9SPHN|nr:hypothetical protein [Sphingomonas sp. KR1UV-12]MDP1027293.1 hypothetical protein [Sphingomonas sp. KR1UV-12]